VAHKTIPIMFYLHYHPHELLRDRDSIYLSRSGTCLVTGSEGPGPYHFALCCWEVGCAPTGCEGEPFSVIPTNISTLISGIKQNISITPSIPCPKLETDQSCPVETTSKMCEISGSHGGEYEDDSFLGYSTVQSC
jgi:hypothetical protein